MAVRKPLVCVGGRVIQLPEEDRLGAVAPPTLQGDTAPYATQTKTYQITNYNSFSSYAVAVSAGAVSISGDTITFVAPATAGGVTLTLTVDGHPTAFIVDVQEASDYTATPTPTPASFGDPLEGGFYAGMIWNQLAQSSTSMAIGVGTKIFTVPNMAGAPIVYRGQMLEVRSRANPTNKFVGTVSGALGTSLTIDVTSVGGSGTFSDWSIMSRFRIIVAPKASGEHAGVSLKSTATAFPSACRTASEGWESTVAMRGAGDAATYPAAHWARGLSINGYTDWYIPSRDELELLWRNLKPVVANNFTTSRGAANSDYQNRGSYGDTTANAQGLNLNSYPSGANYTGSVPDQVAAPAFRTSGTEALSYGAERFWSSSEVSDTVAWFQHWHSEQPGGQSTYQSTKNVVRRIRAIRRSVI